MARPLTRILIVGCPGSGKSTLALQLAALTSIPVVHLDRLYWRPGWTNASSEEFDRTLEQALAAEQFIIDGNFSRTLPRRMAAADAVILLDLPRLQCLFGALMRVARSYGKTRPDMGSGCRERFDAPFLQYIWHFRARQLPETLEEIEAHPEVRLIRLRSRRACRAFVAQVARDGEIL